MPSRPAGQVVARFAPSPTGYLHIGGARTALFNWAFARRHGGVFILRMEDTDVKRSTPEATRRIVEDLLWLGLQWDEGSALSGDPYVNQRGEFGPYFQSQRGELYREYLNKLRDAGRVYDDAGAVRFRMPDRPEGITVSDLVLGDVTVPRDRLEDFIIFKSNKAGGGPTFHFANVVDDLTMGVTHVLRAQEHLMNTPKHLALFEALGAAPPNYAHMPLIFNADGTKMSKRDKAKAAREAARKARTQALPPTGTGIDAINEQQLVDFLDKKNDDIAVAAALARHLGIVLPEIDVHDFRAAGYLRDVLLNYVALLGWSPGGDVERFNLEYLKREFDIERLGKSNARFDRAKLLAFNAQALQAMPLDEFLAELRQYASWAVVDPRFKGLLADAVKGPLFAAAYQPRTRTLADPFEISRFFVIADDEITFDPKAIAKVLHKNDIAGLAALMALEVELRSVEPWKPATIHAALEAFAQHTGRGMGDVAQPLRVAVTGTTVSPAIHDTLAILGKDRTLARIARCLIANRQPT